MRYNPYRSPQADLELTVPVAHRLAYEPSRYRPSPGLVEAVNAALLLGKPLIVAGEPGTGKTAFAYDLAFSLGLPLHHFATKSTTMYQDILYSFDVVARLNDAQTQQIQEPSDYVRLGALGEAIVSGTHSDGLPLPLRDTSASPIRSVVLIDEIDKAPRDFPNDLLTVLDNSRLVIPEANLTIVCEPRFAPVVVATTNSERLLPDPFLRRSVFYTIPFPDRCELLAIMRIHYSDLNPVVAEQVLSVVDLLRASPGIMMLPGPAEALDLYAFLMATSDQLSSEEMLSPARLDSMVSILSKSTEDQLRAHALIRAWQEAPK